MQQIYCPACGAVDTCNETQVYIRTSRGGKPWKCCSECKAYYMLERYEAEQEAKHVESKPWGQCDSAKEIDTYKKRMFLSVIHLIKKYFSSARLLLDIGCSYGGFLMEAQQANFNGYGVDIVPHAIEFVTSQGIPAEVCSSISQLKGVKEASMDVITCLDVNYYWCNQPRELKNAYLKLKNGGCIAIRTVDKSWLFSLGLCMRKLTSNVGERIITRAVNDHRFSMPARSLLKVIRTSGFDVLYTSPLGAIPSYKTSVPDKLCYGIGSLLWGVCKFNVAPGMLILARKPK